MDPQHRLFLECAWEALEHAGYDRATYPGAIGVFAGATLSTYLLLNLLREPARARVRRSRLQVSIGNGGDFLTTRVSYKLNLRGPQPHRADAPAPPRWWPSTMACQSLLNGECDMALAGGVSVNVRSSRRATGYAGGRHRSRRTGTAGPSTRRRRARVFGNGAGVVVLKRLRDALADGDTIHAVIQGSAVNNDGALQGGLHRAQRRGPGRRSSPRRWRRRAWTRTTSATSRRTAPARRSATRSRSRRSPSAFRASTASDGASARSARSRPTSATWTRPRAWPA